MRDVYSGTTEFRLVDQIHQQNSSPIMYNEDIPSLPYQNWRKTIKCFRLTIKQIIDFGLNTKSLS